MWTRLVLFDVMVRTHLTFAAATWAPAYLRLGEMAPRGTPLGALSALHRRGLRVLAGVDIQVRVEVMLVVLVHWPLELLLAKAVWRYYCRVAGLQGKPGAPLVAQLAGWLRTAPAEVYPARAGMDFAAAVDTVAELYRAWERWLCAGIRAS